MELAYLGPLTAVADGVVLRLGGNKQRLVLAQLLVARGRTLTTEQLIAGVWPDDPPAAARNTVQTYVSHLRRTLGSDRVDGEGRGYRLRMESVDIDAVRFEELLVRGRDLLAEDARTATSVLQEALGLRRGPPFGDLGGCQALRSEATRLTELCARALELRFTGELELGLATELIAELEAATATEPLRERRWELLMLALYRDGRQADALLAFERARTVLREEIGADPSPRLSRLHERILRQDPQLEDRRDPEPRRRSRPDERDAVPFPTRLATGTGTPFVGRVALLEDLSRRWREVTSAARSQAVLLSGEPGVGKTRTAVESARQAAAAGATVLAGRCDEGLAVPYQPFVEMLDWQTHHAPAAPLGRLPGELVRLLPDLPVRVPRLPDPVTSDPRLEEHRLLEATASWIASLGAGRGAVLLVDDLQWATAPTLRLLVHVLRTVTSDPTATVLVLATYRDTDLGDDHPLGVALGELRRLEERVAVVDLPQLDVDEVAALVAAITGTADGIDELVRYTLAATEGNPFLVGEVLRHGVETGVARLQNGRWAVEADARLHLPPSVRQVVGNRLRGRSAGTEHVLRTIALLGGEAEVEVLGALVDGGLEPVLDAIDEGVRAGLLVETAPDRVQLNHALVRESLLTALSPPRRRRLHATILDTLERVRPDDAVALATHALQAIPTPGYAARAVHHSLAAGERAAAQRAPSEAIGWFERALELIGALDEVDPSLRAATRCALGEAQRDTGDPHYRDTLLAVAQEGLADGRLDLAARAALANHRAGTASVIGEVDRDRVEVLERLLARLDQDDAADGSVELRARVLALLSLELTFDADQLDRRLRLADEAAALAVGSSDPGLAAWTVTTVRMPRSVPDRTTQLAATVPDAVALADQEGDPALRCASRVAAHQSLLGVGELGDARRLVEEAVALADAEGAPFLQMLTRFNAVQFVVYDGDVAAAEAQTLACSQLAQEIGELDGLAWAGAITAMTAMVTGAYHHLVDAVAGFADTYPGTPAWRAAHAMLLAKTGQHDAARDVLDRSGLHRPDALPRDWIQLSGYASLATTAFELRDAELGAQVVDALTPYQAQWAHVHVFCDGPVAHLLGLAADAAGDVDGAIVHLRRARGLLRERGLRSHGPRVALELGQVLLRRAAPSDTDEARRVLYAGLAEAEEMTMPFVADQLRGLRERVS